MVECQLKWACLVNAEQMNLEGPVFSQEPWAGIACRHNFSTNLLDSSPEQNGFSFSWAVQSHRPLWFTILSYSAVCMALPQPTLFRNWSCVLSVAEQRNSLCIEGLRRRNGTCIAKPHARDTPGALAIGLLSRPVFSFHTSTWLPWCKVRDKFKTKAVGRRKHS